jgi:regulator of protease activity HflC (stomatin/prohibitin superfamily)
MYHLLAPTYHHTGAVTVFDYQRGLLYQRGRFVRVLEPDRYWIWPFSQRVIGVVDLRRQMLSVNNQKLLTADQVALTLSLSVSVEVADPAAFAHKVTNGSGQLYEDTQLAARALVGARPLDVLLQQRDEFDTQLTEAVRVQAQGYGLHVVHAGLKDIILAPKIRDLLLKEVETKRLAQAALLAAREEVATLRALANAARLVADNPHLLALRELETLRTFAQHPGNTVVLGQPGVLRTPPPAPGWRGRPDAESADDPP